ncbi:MAG: hypothetical protein JRN52_13090 [Nitrososphaerota archaeon]|nr:hypothetical protein [Nitrososphaerota archaeon]
MRVSLKVKSRDSDEDLTEPGIEIEGANKWLTIIQNAAKPTKVYTEKNQGVPTQTYQNQPTGSGYSSVNAENLAKNGRWILSVDESRRADQNLKIRDSGSVSL